MFDKKKGAGTVMVANEGSSDLHEAMVDLLNAIERKSPSDMAVAFRAAFSLCEGHALEPKEEG